jgi:hypothetical protein
MISRDMCHWMAVEFASGLRQLDGRSEFLRGLPSPPTRLAVGRAANM